MPGPLQLLTLSTTVALSAYFGPLLLSLLIPKLQAHLPFDFPVFFAIPTQSSPQTAPDACPPHSYNTQLISLDPLLILLHNFIPPAERAAIIAAGEPLLVPSPVTGSTDAPDPSSQWRTSLSAPLDASKHPAVACALARAEEFLGPALLPRRSAEDPESEGRAGTRVTVEMGPAQLVRYAPGQRFDRHHDWFRAPRLAAEDAAVGRRRLYNRAATFFVVLAAENVTQGSGETWFPHVSAAATERGQGSGGGEAGDVGVGEGAVVGGGGGGGGGKGKGPAAAWREHEQGGIAFRPVPGNALFWVNLLANGTGDTRTLHAGLPVEGGVKYGMNIWPRRFFGPDA